MGKLYNDITETIGCTPLVRLNRVTKDCVASVLPQVRILQPAQQRQRSHRRFHDSGRRARRQDHKDTVIIEPTSGNTGMPSRSSARQKASASSSPCPRTMSMERRILLRMLGAEIVLTPGPEGMPGAIRRAEALLKETPNSFHAATIQQPRQPRNPSQDHRAGNLGRHRRQSGLLVAGVGTGGTITGVSEVIKRRALIQGPSPSSPWIRPS